jgi:hypothetical protein
MKQKSARENRQENQGEASISPYQRERQALRVGGGYFAGGALLLIVGFLSGWYWQNIEKHDALRIEAVATEGEGTLPAIEPLSASKDVTAVKTLVGGSVFGATTDCVFVGSKNSTKYHLPTSGSAKRIKPENLVCFTSADDAVARGYEAGSIQ